MEIGVYVLGAVTATLLLVTRNSFVGEQGNMLYVAHMGVGPPYVLYGIFQFVIALGILYNLLTDNKIGLTRQGKYFLVASLFPAAGVVRRCCRVGDHASDAESSSGPADLQRSLPPGYISRPPSNHDRTSHDHTGPSHFSTDSPGLAVLYASFALQWGLPSR